MLAVPASALALTGAVTDTSTAATAPPLQASVTPRRTTPSRTVTVTGNAPASDAGHEAILQTAPGQRARWRNVASTTIGPGGRFRLRTRLRHSGYVRVIETVATATVSTVSARAVTASTVTSSWAANPAGAGAVASAPVPVSVAAQLRVSRGPRNVLAGNPVVVRGRLMPAAAGRPVRLQGRSADGWQTLAVSRTGADGRFRLRTAVTSGLQRRLRVMFAGDRGNAGSVMPAGRLTVYQQSVASWYNDGGSTACGFHAGLGVANLSLPCGTKVRIRYGGRSVNATVDDRGPYVGGRQWDLNQTTAAALGFGGVGTVWTAG